VIRHADDCPTWAIDPPSRPVETTDGSARPIPPDAANGLTSAAYSDVIRREKAEAFLIQEGVINKASLDTIVRLTNERDIAQTTNRDLQLAAQKALKDAAHEIARMAADLLAKDDTIERLWAQLNEATNVPDHNDPKFGFDKTAAFSEPDECCASGRCEVCSPGYNWGRDG